MPAIDANQLGKPEKLSVVSGSRPLRDRPFARLVAGTALAALIAGNISPALGEAAPVAPTIKDDVTLINSLNVEKAEIPLDANPYRYVAESINPAGVQTKVDIPGTKTDFPVFVFDQLLSEPGQSKEAFVVKIAQHLDLFTKATNYEGCGHLAYNPDTQQWGIMLSTNFSQIACFTTTLTPGGYTKAEDSIHSHPSLDRFKANDQDIAVQRAFRGPRSNFIRSNESVGFSERDLRGGPGYLVDKGHIFYHNGNNKTQYIGALPTADHDAQAAKTVEAVFPKASNLRTVFKP